MAPLDRSVRAESSPVARDRFFDCTFVWSPRELVGDEPYLVYADAQSDPFFLELVRACRGAAGFRGVVSDPRIAARFRGVVFTQGPAWRRIFSVLSGARRRADLRVVLHFDNDPTGFWDFAKACGDRLPDIFRAGGLEPGHAPAIAGFVERWAGGRLSGGRLLPLAKLTTRDYRAKIEANGAAITRVLAALADDESRACYARILFGTSEQILSAFARSVFGAQQYMDVTRINPGDVVVNCGVGNGWELPYFLARLRGAGRIHNFDPNMCYHGTVYGEYIDLFADMIVDHPILLGERDGELELPVTDARMVLSGDPGRGAAGEGRSIYACRRLDSLMAEGLAPRIDHIKMDVEGGERHILEGAIGSIRTHRPRLAVAIYHEPEHFWEYPGFLLDSLEDYRFYVRQYGYSRFETLLYAVPMEDDESGSGEERLLHGPVRPVTGPRGGEQVIFYFRDRPGTERAVYARPQRALTRFEGGMWETGELRPAPQMDNDHLAGVLELSDRVVYVGVHANTPGDARLVIGESLDGLDVAWTASKGVGAATCTLVESGDGGVRVLVYEPAVQGARLFRYADRTLVTELDIPLRGEPVAGRLDRDGVLTLDVLSPDRKSLARGRFSADGRIGEEPEATAADSIVGTAIIKSYTDERARRRPCFVAESSDHARLAFLEREGDGRLVERAAIRWDPRLEAASLVIQR